MEMTPALSRDSVDDEPSYIPDDVWLAACIRPERDSRRGKCPGGTEEHPVPRRDRVPGAAHGRGGPAEGAQGDPLQSWQDAAGPFPGPRETSGRPREGRFESAGESEVGRGRGYLCQRPPL